MTTKKNGAGRARSQKMAEKVEESGKKRTPWQFQPGDKNPRRIAPHRSGRQPGTLNKLTNVKNAVLGAFDRAGGEEYLLKMARSKKPSVRALFVQLLTKTIPQEVTGKDGGPIEVHVLHIAKQGLSRLSDDRLQMLYDILQEIGVNETVLSSANDETAVPLLPAPKEADA